MWGNRECNAVSELLWNYMAHRLSEADVERVEAHLSACPACRKEAEAYRETVRALTGVRQTPVPDSRANWQDLRARLERPSERPVVPIRSGWGLPSLAWGSLAVAAALTLFFFHPSGRNQHAVENVDPMVRTPGPSMALAHPSTEIASNGTTHAVNTTPVRKPTHALDRLVLPKEPRINVALNQTQPVHRRHPAIQWAPADQREEHAPPVRPAHRASGTRAVDYAAVDGGRAASNPEAQDYVMAPVAFSADSDTPHSYVIGSVANPSRRVSVPVGSEEREEARGW